MKNLKGRGKKRLKKEAFFFFLESVIHVEQTTYVKY